MKAKIWYIKFPSDADAWTIQFDEPINEREVRAEARIVYHGSVHQDRPLPRGTQVWPEN